MSDESCAGNCESAHYAHCGAATHKGWNPAGGVTAAGYRLRLPAPAPGTTPDDQALGACQTYCNTQCSSLKTTLDTVGYNKRAIFDALGWNVNGIAPYERWAMVGPTIIPTEKSIAYTMMAILFIIFAIWAFMHSIVRSQTRRIFAPLRAINAIVAAYFGPIYLAIAAIAGPPPAVNDVTAGVTAAATKWWQRPDLYNGLLSGLALFAVVMLVLLATGVFKVGKPKVFFCPGDWERSADGTECTNPKDKKPST